MLKAQIRATLSINDPVINAYIPNFISQAQARISREVQIFDLVKVIEVPLRSGESILEKPTDWVREISAYYFVSGVPIQLKWRPLSMMLKYSPAPFTEDESYPLLWGEPSREDLFFTPIPSNNINISITYLAQDADFDGDESSTILSETYPSLLLYASLLEATPFVQSDERIQIWENFYKNIVDTLVQNNAASKIDVTSNIGVV